MFKYNTVAVFLLLLFFDCKAQNIQLDHVTKKELQETICPLDNSAPAAYLFKNAKTTFRYSEKDGFVSITEFQIKIKIYKNEGLKYANFRIPYYVGYKTLNDEFVSIEAAYTYNLEDDKIVKTKVTKVGKFDDKQNDYWAVKSIAFPNVKVGSVIELDYELKSENLSVLPEFQYQYDIPVNYASYKTEIPEFYLYKTIKNGYVDVEIKQEVERASQDFQSKADISTISRTMQYNQVTSSYIAKNVPALIEENYVNNINNYYGKLTDELQTVRMPEQKPKQIAESWEAVAKTIYAEKEFGEELLKSDYYLENLKVQLKSATTLEEKLAKVFNFVKSRMNWNGFYGYFPRKKLEAAYDEKTGNTAEINLILVSMLRMAGLQANPVLLSTRENGFASFPNRSLLNYVIAAVTLEDKVILLDATHKLSSENIVPIRVLNGSGRLIKSDGTTKEIDLMPQSNSQEAVIVMATINQQGEVAGKIRHQYFDYNAFLFRDKYNGMTKESYIEALEAKYEGLQLKDYEVQNNTDLSKPIIENYSFNTANAIESIGDKMYFSPFLFFAMTENPFKQETREYPVDFNYPRKDKYNVSIAIPDGYVVETLPEPKAVSMPDNLGNFKYNISSNGNQVQLLYSLDLNKAVVNPEYYEALKKFFKELINKHTDKIVLKKA